MKIRGLRRRLRILRDLPDEVDALWEMFEKVSTRLKALEDLER